MNLFQLVIKQMRQRALSTWLTLLSVLLGVGLATAILLLKREGNKLFGQSDFGYDMIVGPKGSKLQLVLNTVYHLSSSPGLIPYSYYEDFPQMDSLEWAVPYAVGDEYNGYRIVGTLPKLFKGFPQARQKLSDLIGAQKSLNASSASADERANRQNEIRNQLAGVSNELNLEAPDATARIQDAIDAIDQLATNPAKTPADLQRLQQRILDSIIAAKVLATGPAEYRRGKSLDLAEGKIFHPKKFEAVVGADVAQRGGLKLGSHFQAQHGGAGGEQHSENWTVVGVLQKTHTANDRVIFIPLVSFYAIGGHEKALVDLARVMGTATTRPHDQHVAPTQPAAAHAEHEHEHTMNPDGTIELKIPKSEWTLAAILARSKAGSEGTEWAVNNGPMAMVVNPATEMSSFFDTFLKGSSMVLLLISVLVTIVAAVSILVSIYNSVSARRKEIAILRALGATRQKVLTIICVEAGLVGIFGGVGGLIVGHLLGAAGSLYLQRLLGQGINWAMVDRWEMLYVLLVIGLAVLAGLVPATKAYRTPVATNLVAT